MNSYLFAMDRVQYMTHSKGATIILMTQKKIEDKPIRTYHQ